MTLSKKSFFIINVTYSKMVYYCSAQKKRSLNSYLKTKFKKNLKFFITFVKHVYRVEEMIYVTGNR